MYILAALHINNYRGQPVTVSLEWLQNTSEADVILREFFNRFNIQTDAQPAWYLTSYWG